MPSINPILDMVAKLNEDQAASLQQQSALMAEATKAQATVATAGREALDASVRAKETELRAAQKAQEATRVVNRSMGGEVGTPEDIISILAQDFRSSTLKARQARSTVEAIDSTDVVSSPLQWLAGQFARDSIVQEHNAAATNANASEEAMNQIAATTTATAQAQKAVAQTITDSSVQDLLTAQMQSGLAELAKVEHENLRHNLADIRALQEGKHQLLDNTVKAVNMQFQAAQDARAEEHLRMQKEQQAWARQMKEEALAQKAAESKQTQEAESTTLDLVNTGAGQWGLPAFSNIKDLKAFAATAGGKAKLDMLMESGIKKASTGRVSYGDSASTTFKNLATIGADPRQSSNKFLAQLYSDGIEQMAVARKVTSNTKEAEATALANLDALYSKKIAKWSNNAETEGSKFAATSISAIATADSSLAKDAGYNVFIKPLLDAGIDNAASAQIASSAKAAMDAGVITLEEASKSLAKFYSAAKHFNNTAYKFDASGYMLQSAYNVLAPNASVGTTLDLSNPVQARKLLLYSSKATVAEMAINKLFGLQGINNVLSDNISFGKF